jgi:hypothetical protein
MRGRLAINDTVYAELSAGFTTQSELDEIIAEMSLTLPPMSRPALFLAGQAFRRYRAGGGQRPNVLADFFIGARASIESGLCSPGMRVSAAAFFRTSELSELTERVQS